MKTETRLYGVSTGDGNNGVSHVFADYYVRTDDPYLLAAAASYSCWKQEVWGVLDRELQVDGEAEYTISAWLYDEPGFVPDEDCEGGPAAFVLEVFPVDEDGYARDRPVYDGTEDALGEAEIARARRVLG